MIICEIIGWYLCAIIYPVGFLLTAILYIENDIVTNPLLIICWPIGLIQFIQLKINKNQMVNCKTFKKREIVNAVLKEISDEYR